MKKHLIYLGYTGTAHRIALFNENNILVRKVPVKDVPVLSDDLEFINCTVVNGKPIPNLKGVKPLCSTAWRTDHKYIRSTKDANLKELWAFPNKRPDYFYACIPADIKSGVGTLRLDALLNYSYSYNIWDGLCKDTNFYVIGLITSYKNSKRHKDISYVLCMTSDGHMFFAAEPDVNALDRMGGSFVQVGTPELSYPQAYDSLRSCEGRFATVGIPVQDKHKALWSKCKGWNVPEFMEQAEAVWWTNIQSTAICDLRGYSKARVFGIKSGAKDAKAFIFPESTEEIWVGIFEKCTSLASIYMPSSVTKLHELGLPAARIKNLTIYSSSPVVEDFCKRKGITYEYCASSDAMLTQYYTAFGSAESGSDYLDAQDASSIAALGGYTSDKLGSAGTIWSAILFSCMDKGIATDELQRRYPVTATCDYPIHTGDIKKAAGDIPLCHGEYSQERCRTLAGAFTQFYPLSTKEVKKVCSIVRFRMGDYYNLYVEVNAFYDGPKMKKNIFTGRLEEVEQDHYVNYHMAYLVDVYKGRVIHRFACNNMLYKTLRNLAGMCNFNQPPCGVLRYADKLPITHNDALDADADRHEFVRGMFSSLMPVSYGLKNAKRKMVGIDLHTGNLVTLDYTPDYYIREIWTTIKGDKPVVLLDYVRTVKNIKVHPEDANLSECFAKDCTYSKNKE